MKSMAILLNLFLIIGQLINFTGCKQYIVPNNHNYYNTVNSGINENIKLINNDPKLKLTSNDRFAIPVISKKFVKPIDDFTPPHYLNDGVLKSTNISETTTKSNNNFRYIKQDLSNKVDARNSIKKSIKNSSEELDIKSDEGSDEISVEGLDEDADETSGKLVKQDSSEDADEDLSQDLKKDLEKNLKQSKNLDLEEID